MRNFLTGSITLAALATTTAARAGEVNIGPSGLRLGGHPDGLLSMRANPPAKREAKWTLESRRAVRLNLKAGKTAMLGASFTMTKARSKIGPADQSKIDELKGAYCVNDKTRKAMAARLKAKGSWTMTEYSFSLDSGVDGVDNPPGKLSVQKPGPDTILSFCGMNDKTAGGPVVESGGKPEDLVMSFALFDPS